MVTRATAIRLLVIIYARAHGGAIIPPSTRELYNASPKENIITKQTHRKMGWCPRLPLSFLFFSTITGSNLIFESNRRNRRRFQSRARNY